MLFKKSKKPRVFISYAREDWAIAYKLKNALAGRQVDVWIDDEEIRTACPVLDTIKGAIDEANYLLLLNSKRSVKSQWVETELQCALNGACQILPVRLDEAPLPDALEKVLWENLRDPTDFAPTVKRLVKAINPPPAWPRILLYLMYGVVLLYLAPSLSCNLIFSVKLETAQTLIDHGDYDAAYLDLDRLARNPGWFISKTGRVSAHRMLADAYRQLEKGVEADAHYRLALVELYRGQLPLADLYDWLCEDANPMPRELAGPQLAEYAHVLRGFAELRPRTAQQMLTSKRLYEEAERLFTKLHDFDGQARLRLGLSEIKRQEGDFAGALSELRGVDIDKLKSLALQARLTWRRARIYFDSSDFTKASPLYLKAASILLHAKNPTLTDLMGWLISDIEPPPLARTIVTEFLNMKAWLGDPEACRELHKRPFPFRAKAEIRNWVLLRLAKASCFRHSSDFRKSIAEMEEALKRVRAEFGVASSRLEVKPVLDLYITLDLRITRYYCEWIQEIGANKDRCKELQEHYGEARSSHNLADKAMVMRSGDQTEDSFHEEWNESGQFLATMEDTLADLCGQ